MPLQYEDLPWSVAMNRTTEPAYTLPNERGKPSRPRHLDTTTMHLLPQQRPRPRRKLRAKPPAVGRRPTVCSAQIHALAPRSEPSPRLGTKMWKQYTWDFETKRNYFSQPFLLLLNT
jgi:hypothetical protein